MKLLNYVKENQPIIHIGGDFNVAHMAAILSLLIGGKLYTFHEYTDLMDTPDVISAIKEDFPNNKIIYYPDNTGVKRTTADASVSDITLLRQAKFTIRSRPTNPTKKDRIAAVNMAFKRQRLFIDHVACPVLTECLEQQIYKDNGQPDKDHNQDHPVDALGYKVHWLMPVKKNTLHQGTHVA